MSLLFLVSHFVLSCGIGKDRMLADTLKAKADMSIPPNHNSVLQIVLNGEVECGVLTKDY